MKPVALAMGIVLIIMGIMSYITIQDFMTDCQSSANNGGPLAGYLREMCGQIQLMQYGLTATAVVGFGITIYGVVAKKKIVEKPTITVHHEPSFTTSDVLKIVKSLEEAKEKHDELEKKYTILTSYLKRNGIEVPDFIMKNKQ
ncbi:MAG: hypothetical protein ACRD9Q_02015 [Nitrososphaeraceae archaeon]